MAKETSQTWPRRYDMKDFIFKLEGYPGLSRWAQCDHKAPWKRAAGGSQSESRTCDHRRRGRSDEASGQQIRVTSRCWEDVNGFPVAPPAGTRVCGALPASLRRRSEELVPEALTGSERVSLSGSVLPSASFCGSRSSWGFSSTWSGIQETAFYDFWFSSLKA